MTIGKWWVNLKGVVGQSNWVVALALVALRCVWMMCCVRSFEGFVDGENGGGDDEKSGMEQREEGMRR
jgi:hypothetical protein